MEVERKMAKAKIQLLLHHPFYGHLLLSLDFVEIGTLTMGVDGKRLFWSREFVEGLSNEELVGVFAHETLHLALDHLGRRGLRDKFKWNLAADHAVNPLVKKEGLALPEGILYDKKFENLPAERIYDLLPDLPPDKGGGSGKGEGKGISKNKSGWDDHSKWEDGEYDLPSWKAKVASAITAARFQGKYPGYLEELVGELLYPKLNWKIILRDFVQASVRNDYRLYPPNKKFLYIPVYMASLKGESIEIGASVDTSGSISSEEVRAFLSEVQGIMSSFDDFTIHLFQCDAGVHSYVVITPFEELPRKVVGRGGTSFIPVFEEVEKRNLRLSCLIFLTDGYGNYPSSPPLYPVLWVMSTGKTPPFGEVVRLGEERR